MRKFFISLMMALAIVSCSTDELSSGGGKGSQKGIRLVLSTDDLHDVNSRAVNEDVVHDLNILEYINGAIVKVVYFSDLSAEDLSKGIYVSGLEDFSATTLDNKAGDTDNTIAQNGIENFIFVVANYGKQINSEDVSSLSNLKAFKMDFSGKTDMTNLPMTGFYYDGIDGSSTTEMHVSLQRAVAKVNFTLSIDNFRVGGQTPSSISVESIELCNVPGQITLYPCQDRPSLPNKDDRTTVAWSGTPFPTKAEMEAEGGSVTYGDEQNQSSDANTYEAYIPENARGSYTAITKNTDKRPSKCDTSISEDDEKDKDKSYTHFRVVLKYVDPSDSKLKKATYRFYLGGNETGDMNLLRNTKYTVTTNINGVKSSDTRITVEDAGPAPEVITNNANCYMIDMSDVQSGSDKIVTIPLLQVINGWNKISSSTTVQSILNSDNWNIQTEWKTWEGSSNVTGTKSSDGSLTATLTIPSTVTNGNNAVVKLVSGGTTYWSWHLWFTDYKPSATDGTAENGQVHQYKVSDAFKSGGLYEKKYMMDRNLGATITGVSGAISQPSSSNAKYYYGLMYQWGRKDPFIGSDGTGNTKDKLYDAQGGTYTNINSTSSGAKSLTYSVQNPGTFFYNSSSPYDWVTPQNNDLWDNSGTSKSVFDPCPPGWRVPLGGGTAANNPWYGITSYFSWPGSTSTSPEKGRLYSYSGTQAWYPASGRLNYGSGTLYFVGSNGYYWSATPRGQYGYYLGFNSGNVSPANSYSRAYGFPVRCVQE